MHPDFVREREEVRVAICRQVDYAKDRMFG
jgi:hypothetical protein